jgi:perosamine synthetase
MREMISMSAPDIDDLDIEAVVEVLRSGRLSLGPKIEAFEEAFSQYIGVRHAVAVSSGTAALHLVVKSLKLGPGDEVLVPSFTFAASVNALLYEGVTPVFVDIEDETFNLDLTDLRRKITPRTKGIMAVDVFGHPAEWNAIEDLAGQYQLKVIDDSCEALGAEYKGRKLGHFGDASAFAFYPNKQITTGEGGIIVTNNSEIARVSRSLANQGRSEMGTWLEHERLGYNYRLDEMSAALGLSQLGRIETFLAKRERVAEMYAECLKDSESVRIPQSKPHVRRSWFVYVVTLREDIDRDTVAKAMEESGIPVRCYFSPIHLQPYVREHFGFKGGELPTTESIAQRTLALPFYNNLTENQVDRVVESLLAAVTKLV